MLSITDQLLPTAKELQYVADNRLYEKAAKFTAGRLIETVRIVSSLIEQVVVRTLYTLTYPTRWIAPKVHASMNERLKATNLTLTAGFKQFMTPTKEKLPLEPEKGPLSIREKVEEFTAKHPKKAIIVTALLAGLVITAYYYGPSLFASPDLPKPPKPPAGNAPPLGSLGGSPGAPEIPMPEPETPEVEIRRLMPTSTLRTIQQLLPKIPSGKTLELDSGHDNVTCKTLISRNAEDLYRIESDCFQQATKYSIDFQRVIVDKNPFKPTVTSDGPWRYVETKLDTCLKNRAIAFFKTCISKGYPKNTCIAYKNLHVAESVLPCIKEVGRIVE